MELELQINSFGFLFCLFLNLQSRVFNYEKGLHENPLKITWMKGEPEAATSYTPSSSQVPNCLKYLQKYDSAAYI